ncbi:MAG: type 1 glutamine amidotransferase [Synergistetes bacterium]|nr:type 1 glutamine amidotransferase [Synergistota bacterium]MDW8191728.1 type 1 glutamine amidotransferase domain-containing protein [Synergistota bacterium]
MERLKGRRIAILVEDTFEDLELWYPLLRMKEEGAEVVLVGPEKRTYKGKYGVPAEADITSDQAKADDFDAVIIPGGYSPDRMRRDPKLVNFVKEAGEKGKVVAAICHGPWMLASANLLRGRKATAFFAIKDDVVNAGAEFVDAEAVVDGNIITSRTPKDLPAFCKAIIEALLSGSPYSPYK